MSADEIDSLKAEDLRQKRCPILGHFVNFGYCREPGRKLPCGRILECWCDTFDIGKFAHRHFSDQTIQMVLVPRHEKVPSLVELFQRGRNQTEFTPKNEKVGL